LTKKGCMRPQSQYFAPLTQIGLDKASARA
jgi:hypothetical protein